ncbi:MAG: glycosyl transferase family 1 [Betaproteobacteria bacterium HGW-Betaproteobacteria-12]|nr:MAG: glycosyl transferase family 1 [Betaproteobacteria bacterium HGW-Betaproteobacteria-12]
MTGRPIRTLLFSTLYPSVVRPVHGIFVETRLRELLKTGEVQTKVVAPVPWFPFKGQRFGEYGKFAATPKHEVRHGIEVHHPRYFLPPKVGMLVAPRAMASAAMPVIRRLISDGFDFDLIDAHYYYPDGVAAGIIAEQLGKPFVVTARGTDLNLIPEYPKPRQMILETARKAAASIGVCKALMDRLKELGADSDKLHVLRNGVDLERFQPVDRREARERLGLPLDRRIIISVGRLAEVKGHHVAIEALGKLPQDILVLVGGGPERQRLADLAKRCGVENRVRFAGQVANEELKNWYSAADVLVLCSSREGWANVLLESMACGTPVVATTIWGTPEVVASRDAGVLMQTRDAEGLLAALNELTQSLPDRATVRAYAEKFSWDATSQGQLALFSSVLGKGTHCD